MAVYNPTNAGTATTTKEGAPKHFAPTLRGKPKPSTERGLEIISEYLDAYASLDFCLDIQRKKKKCCCLTDALQCEGGSLWIPHIATALHDFFAKSRAVRNEFLVDRIKIVKIAGNKCRLPLPAVGKPHTYSELPTICKDTYFALLGVGKTQYSALLCQAKENELFRHPLEGKPSNNRLDDTVTAHLEVFFENLKELAAPRATRMVRMEVGMDVRDADEELDELPSHFTGRHLYARLCSEFGYTASLKNDKGAIQLTLVEGFEGELIEPPCLKTFQSYWKKNYPKLIIPNAREDVCNDCFILSHSFRYFASKRRNGEQNTEEQEDEEAANQYESQEAAVKQASVHVERAEAQRKYFNSITDAGGEDTDLIVCDFMQNLGLPYLGSEQSGATYYYSPLNVFVFGIVDMRTKRLHAFVYDEGKGKKGGNNVASMLHDYLRLYGMLDSTSKHLKVVMDNCAGQNKVSQLNKTSVPTVLLIKETNTFYFCYRIRWF
jgi:hypothetical protein